MRLAKLILAGLMFTPAVSFSAAAWAQQTLTGTVITIDRISGTVGIKQAPSGTVGASSGGAAEQQFKAPEGALNTLHAGDKVTFTVSESGGKKTITKIEPQ
jgi:Cu/Ag efflux protein CusF